VISEQG